MSAPTRPAALVGTDDAALEQRLAGVLDALDMGLHQGVHPRIGVLDVGGATLEDVTPWSVWQDTSASHRGSGLQEEETQGNGGKAYMYRLFAGPAHILGVRDRRRNAKGFDGVWFATHEQIARYVKSNTKS